VIELFSIQLNLAGQFKSAKAFNWLAMQHARCNVKFLWNFFESGHGKGEHDGAGACVKRALRQHELAGINCMNSIDKYLYRYKSNNI
jgi:hypothetical protein